MPRGTPGELLTRGYCVMPKYWNDPEKTAEAIDEARWIASGDIAVVDDEGYFQIVGRIKDMLIRGGENIFPREIEEFLYTHPAVEQVEVIGVPDEKYGEEVCAWIKLREGAERDGGRDPRVLQGPDRAFQDPALRQVRRRVPDDDHRQGAEIRDAPDDGARNWPAEAEAWLTRLPSSTLPADSLVRLAGLGCATASTLVALYTAMVRTRTFDAKAIALQRTGRLGTYASSLGQEAVSVGVASAMTADDVFLPSFREHGGQLWRGVTLEELFLYWGGDERGNDFAGPRQDFPVCIPVASQFPACRRRRARDAAEEASAASRLRSVAMAPHPRAISTRR